MSWDVSAQNSLADIVESPASPAIGEALDEIVPTNPTNQARADASHHGVPEYQGQVISSEEGFILGIQRGDGDHQYNNGYPTRTNFHTVNLSLGFFGREIAIIEFPKGGGTPSRRPEGEAGNLRNPWGGMSPQ